MKRLLLIAVTTILLGFQFNFANADAKPKIMPVNSHAFGKTYHEWAADWLKWALSIPVSANPILDTTGAFAAVGQTGKVWFLAGTTGTGAVPPVVRTVTIPTGTPLFFPIINYFWVNTPEYGDAEWSLAQEALARGIIAAPIDSASGLGLKIDGRSLSNLEDFRIASSSTECTIPASAAENIFGADLVNSPYHCVADGYWVFLPPLSAGTHTIRFTGSETVPSPFSLDVTYKIKVKPGHHSVEISPHP